MAKKAAESEAKEGMLRYIGTCSKCGIAMYRENGVILTAGRSDCQHVLKEATSNSMIQRVFYLTSEEDAYISKRAKKNKCSRGEYLRAIIEADRKIAEGGAAG